VLAGVEDQREPSLAQMVEHGRPPRAIVGVRQPEHGGDLAEKQRGVAKTGQLNEPDAVGEPVGGQRGGTQADARLADPRGTDDRHQPGRRQQRGDRGKLGLAADEAGGLRGQQAEPSPMVPGLGGRDWLWGCLTCCRNVTTVTLA